VRSSQNHKRSLPDEEPQEPEPIKVVFEITVNVIANGEVISIG